MLETKYSVAAGSARRMLDCSIDQAVDALDSAIGELWKHSHKATQVFRPPGVMKRLLALYHSTGITTKLS
jgi:hypothetical protein